MAREKQSRRKNAAKQTRQNPAEKEQPRVPDDREDREEQLQPNDSAKSPHGSKPGEQIQPHELGKEGRNPVEERRLHWGLQIVKKTKNIRCCRTPLTGERRSEGHSEARV